MNRVINSACLIALSSMSLLVPGVAHATGGGGEGRATALRATVLGHTAETEPTRASNSGAGQEKTGPATPLPLLPGQPYAALAGLAQDAAASDNGTSVACAGVAGDQGAANAVSVGDSSCVEPGPNVTMPLTGLDLSGLLDAPVSTGTGSISTLLEALGTAGLDASLLTGPLETAVDDVAAHLADAGVVLDLGAIESSCTYDGQAAGTTYLTHVGVSLVIPGLGTRTLLTLDTQPAPDTSAVARLDDISALVVDDLEASLDTAVGEIDLGLLDAALDAAQDDIVAQVVEQFRPALQTVQDRILDLRLNVQETDGRSISVTGLRASLVEDLSGFGTPPPVDLTVAEVGCGPLAAAAPVDGGGAPAPTPTPAPGGTVVAPTTDTAGNPVPTVVDAGRERVGSQVAALLAGMTATAGVGVAAVGVAARRRRTARA